MNVRKYFISLVSIIVSINILSNGAFAFDNFIKSTYNPLSISKPSEFTDLHQADFLYTNNSYLGVFTLIKNAHTYFYKSSSLNGYDWIISNEVYSELKNIYAPRLYYESDLVKLIFTADEGIGGPHKIYSITCSHNYVCDNISKKRLLSPIPSTWEWKSVASGFLIKSTTTYFLFYSGWDGASWKIGIATSPDGDNFTRCPNNPIISPGDGPSLFQKDGKYYLFYHNPINPHSIRYVESTDELSCNMSWSPPTTILTPDQPYDTNHMIAPSVFEKDGQIWLYYSGLNQEYKWTINLATSGQIIPSPTPKPKIIFSPGMFGSWNKDAIIYNKEVSNDSWIMNPILEEYKGIKDTFANLGYEEGKDFFIFNYDWRQFVTKDTNDLNSYILNNFSPDDSVYLVGHSLGGIVSRIYSQINTDKINKITTVGSPHKGTPQAYKALSGGDIESDNPLAWIATKIALQLYKKSPFEPDYFTMQTNIKSLFDILPIYDYLQDENANLIDVSTMDLQNNLLLTYNDRIDSIQDKFITIGGDNLQTPYRYEITKPSTIDIFLGRYKNGRPTQTLYAYGDSTINSQSSIIGDNKTILPNLDHREIIYSKDGIKSILDSLSIPYDDADIIPSSKTDVFPSLLFLILSPAKMEVEFNSNIFDQNEGMIFIPNALSGQYTLNVKGIEKGHYTIIVGSIGNNYDKWTKLYGKINNNNPSAQIDSYIINFDPDSDIYPLSIDQLFTQIAYILNNNKSNKFIPSAIKHITQAKKQYINKNNKMMEVYLRKTHSSVFNAMKFKKFIQNDLYDCIENIEYLYGLTAINPKYTNPYIYAKIHVANKLFHVKTKQIQLKQRIKDVTLDKQILNETELKLEKAQEALNNGKYSYSLILAETATKLLQSIK